MTNSPNTKEEGRSSGGDRYLKTDDLKVVLKARAIRGGVLTYLSRLINYPVQLASTVLLARLLIPEDFGLVTMVTSINGILLMLRDIGLGDAVIQAKSINQRQMSTLFWINALFNCGVALVVVVLSPLIAVFYHEPRIQSICIILSLTFIFYGISDLHFAILKRNMQFGSITVAQLLSSVASNLAAVLMAWKGLGYWSLVARNVVMAVTMVAVGWIACGWRPGLPSRRSGTKPFLFFGANSIGYLIVNYFSRNLDKTMVGKKFGAVPLGYYDKAFSLFLLPVSQLTSALHHVAVTTLSKLRDEPPEFKRYFLTAIEIIAFFGMPVCFFLCSMSRDVVLILLGPKWIATSELFFILTASGGMHIIYSTQEWLHVSLGRSDRWFRWGIFAFIVTVAAYVAGLMISMKAMALAYSLSVFALTGPAIAYAGKPVGLRFREVFSSFWRFFAAAALAGLCCWLVVGSMKGQGSHALRLLVDFLVYVVAYLLGVVALHRSVKPILRFISLVGSFFLRVPASEDSK
jgi:O-antigen/teichoic acid export membrane protein